MISALLAFVLGLLGAASAEDGALGWALGVVLGLSIGQWLELRKRLRALEQQNRQLLVELRELSLSTEQRLGKLESPGLDTPPVAPAHSARANIELDQAAVRDAAPASRVDSEPVPAWRQDGAQESWQQQRPMGSTHPPDPDHVAPAQAASGPTEPAAASSDGSLGAPVAAPIGPYVMDPFDAGARWLRDLLFGGNTIVRVGILVLLMGVALLMRWAAEHALFPIELRMGAAALLGLALVAVGYKQRSARPGFGHALQGGGVAALYLVIFFSYRSYGLLPAGLTFALLLCVALSSGLLAVLQDARSLVVIAQVGGFVAPVLASSGGGSHVALFSYYLLLNLLVFAVAWFKPWRGLNLLGFAFTFGVASAWGALRYRPEHFASTEPFLIAFFLLYATIPILYALRRPGARGWVDASLVFGTPLAALGLQYAMVRNMPFGMAFSCVGLASFYVLVGRVLYVRAESALRSLIQAFAALAVGFATLAVPYGFDNHDLTGATWALEGAGLYWLGTRQTRWLSRAAGSALQLLAAGALLLELADGSPGGGLPVLNARFLASALVCASCLFVARHAHAARGQHGKLEARGLQLLIALGLSLLVGALHHELTLHVAAGPRPGVFLLALCTLGLALELAGRRLAWPYAVYPAVLLMVLLWPALWYWHLAFDVHPLGRAGWLGFPLGLLLSLQLLHKNSALLGRPGEHLHALFLCVCSTLLGLEALHLTCDFAQLSLDWGSAALGITTAAALGVVLRGARGASFPLGRHAQTYVVTGGALVALFLGLWTLFSNATLRGDSAPLPYVPLLNPLDLAQLAVFAALLAWLQRLRSGAFQLPASIVSAMPALLAALGFWWLNALLARAVHHYAHVAFTLETLWRSTPLQVSLSVAWSSLGLLLTVLASRRGLRALWLVGATLLGVVVVKLFSLDLEQLSTGAKIGTFLAVGLLLVLVGYFAPVPPAAAPAQAAGEVK